jgi:polyisoprenoid-binding protein YceI
MLVVFRPFLVLLLLIGSTSSILAQKQLRLEHGTISFISEAPLETIEATSNNLKGVLDAQANRFAFSVDLNSFEGFNNALQKEHFNENYLETPRFPKATFSGKLIDKVEPDAVKQTIRAKGTLEIHGVEIERIIEVTIYKNGTHYSFSSEFSVPLTDHGITVPKLVHQKIAETVVVHVNGAFLP